MDVNEEREHMETVAFGIEVEAFLERHPIGRYLKRKIVEEEEAAKERLTEVDPEDAKAVRAVQNDFHLAKRIDRWLAQAIAAGYQAEAQLRATEV